MLEEYIRRLQASLWEEDRQALADQRVGEELAQRAARQRACIAEQQGILDELKAEMGIADDETGGRLLSPSGNEVVRPTIPGRVYERGSTISAIRGPDFWRFEPDRDEATDEPIYDDDVVRGKKTSRERALAAARVYGYRLREPALANAIFRTGETRAADAASIRGSLGGLVKYGTDWRRERGFLIYQGEGLKPDQEMIGKLVQKRHGPRQSAHREDISQNES